MFRPNLNSTFAADHRHDGHDSSYDNECRGTLRDRYSFTTDATDSVGGKNGTLVGTNGSFAGGQLVLANTGESSQNPGTTGAYLDLPNGLISSAASAGTTSSVTVEMWMTMQQHRDWAAAFSAGNSINGENTSDCCNDDQPYMQIIPRTGDGGQGNDFRVTTNSYGGPEGWVDDAGAGDGTDLAIGRKEHIVAVFDQSGGMPGNVTVYRNGALMGTSPMAANFNLKTFQRADNSGGDVNVWLGRSQWPDSLVAASFDELRVYSHALTAQEALADTVFGPDIVGATQIPSIQVDKTTGAITLKNNAAQPVKLEYYSITSAGDALKTNTWSSLDAQNYNAVDGPDAGSIAGDSAGEGWDKAGGSNANQLIELFLSPAGSTLAPNAMLNLGNAYNTSTFGSLDGDLVFKFGVIGGGSLPRPSRILAVPPWLATITTTASWTLLIMFCGGTRWVKRELGWLPTETIMAWLIKPTTAFGDRTLTAGVGRGAGGFGSSA